MISLSPFLTLVRFFRPFLFSLGAVTFLNERAPQMRRGPTDALIKGPGAARAIAAAPTSRTTSQLHAP
jgi:hypothetical protein